MIDMSLLEMSMCKIIALNVHCNFGVSFKVTDTKKRKCNQSDFNPNRDDPFPVKDSKKTSESI